MTGIAVYDADMCPPHNPNTWTRTRRRDTHKSQQDGRWGKHMEKQKIGQLSLKEARRRQRPQQGWADPHCDLETIR